MSRTDYLTASVREVVGDVGLADPIRGRPLVFLKHFTISLSFFLLLFPDSIIFTINSTS